MDEQPLDRDAIRKLAKTWQFKGIYRGAVGPVLALLDLLEQTEHREVAKEEVRQALNVRLNEALAERDVARRERDEAVTEMARVATARVSQLKEQVARLTEERDALAIDDRDKYAASTTRWRGNPMPQRAIEATAAVPVVPDPPRVCICVDGWCVACPVHGTVSPTDKDGMMTVDDGVARLEERVLQLETFLRAAKRSHYYCEDCWYSCPKAPDGCCDDTRGDACNCGADEFNASIELVLAYGAEA